MSKEVRERFTYINNVVGWEGQINATHIATKFQLSREAATGILKQYRAQFPTYLQYDLSQKKYIATGDFDHSFIHNNSFNSFSQYLAAIEFASDDSSHLLSGIALEVEAPSRNINPLQVRPILRAIREQLQIDIGYISLSSPNYLDQII